MGTVAEKGAIAKIKHNFMPQKDFVQQPAI
jgi:hypothetical protein